MDTKHVFIFDFDDTIFPSTWLKNNKSVDMVLMKELEKYLINTFTILMEFGHVAIVTNASKEWIDSKMKFYFKDFNKIYEKLIVLSCRDLYSKLYPKEYTKWKILTFAHFMNFINLEKDCNYKILSFGDSNQEKIAVETLGRAISNSLVFSVKFMKKPTDIDLVREWEIINRNFMSLLFEPSHRAFQINIKKDRLF
jgi:hypothetical protein